MDCLITGLLAVAVICLGYMWFIVSNLRAQLKMLTWKHQATRWGTCEDCGHRWDVIKRKCTNCKPLQQSWYRARLAYLEQIILHYVNVIAKRRDTEPGDDRRVRVPLEVLQRFD